MQTNLEQSIIHFLNSEATAKYYYDSEFKDEEITKFVNNNNGILEEKLSSDYYQVYKISSNLYFLNYRAIGIFALFKELELVLSEVSEIEKSDSISYEEDIVQYSLSKFTTTLLNDEITIKRNLTERFNLSPDVLDYSIGSLLFLDEILDSNRIDSKFIKENLLDISYYIGTIYLREEGGEWEIHDFQEGLKLPMLISKKGKAINLVRAVYNSFTQEYGAIINPSSIYRGTTKSMFRVE